MDGVDRTRRHPEAVVPSAGREPSPARGRERRGPHGDGRGGQGSRRPGVRVMAPPVNTLAANLALALDPAALGPLCGVNLDAWQANALRSDAKRQSWNIHRQGGKRPLEPRYSLQKRLDFRRRQSVSVVALMGAFWPRLTSLPRWRYRHCGASVVTAHVPLQPKGPRKCRSATRPAT